ncbi:hypothetical protein ABZ922_21560 [Streptomyces shenzhenensis]|uniref:hypothetical protein n=1 Tax=Streptomyces shenzhenensis TaxID=943815 RepID=UPI00340A5233
MHFCTDARERRARNLERNPEVVPTIGSTTWDRGYDLVFAKGAPFGRTRWCFT